MKNIQISQPSDTVQIHLPNGQTLEGPRGASVGEFLSAVEHRSLLVGAIVNGELRELTYPIRMEAKVEPVLMDSADGARIYRRSLTFLLEKAFADLFPEGTLYVDHSVASGGYFCQVTGRAPLSDEEIETLKAHMQKLVEADLPFERMEVPLQEAIEHFRSKGYEDKVSLLKYRKKNYLTLYRLEDHLDYHHGYMVPSTGYLRIFDLKATDGGFTLGYPRRHKPNELQPMPEYPKLLAAFRQYGGWLTRLGIENVGSLNEAIEQGRADEIVLVSEAFHEQNLADIARTVANHLDKSHLILIAGPSSSGKTTTSKRLTIQLLALGISPFPLELDNYFLDRDKTPLGADGKPDFESIDALDLPLLWDQLPRLIRGEEVQLPRYNFKEGRSEPGKVIQLKRGQPIILEGIHGMDPRLIPDSLRGEAFRIYVSALTQLNLDRHNRVSTTDTRLIRRIVRDARERGYNAAQTIANWEAVRRGEKRHIFPFQENADVMFNSALAYEMAALKPLAEPLLRQVPFGTPEYIEAKRLLAFLEWFLPLDVNLVPDNSLLREFLGGSILKDFTVWKDK
ncbi:MAG: TGS domain-containing protein [Chloroflexota bacterium]|nr:nucleoside kinase [Chloroflexota bacterium]MBI5702420.1 nucleoside kinase [Chloroflexota bacterium]